MHKLTSMTEGESALDRNLLSNRMSSLTHPKNLTTLRIKMADKVIITAEEIEKAKREYFEKGGKITDQKSDEFTGTRYMTVEERLKNAKQMMK